MTAPFGGMGRTVSDVESVDLEGTVFDDGMFAGVADTTYQMGTILAREDSGAFRLIPFVDGGVSGAGVAIGVLKTPFTTDATPTDVPLRYIVSGQVRENLLILQSVGLPGVAITELIKDNLRDHSIVALSRMDIAKLDN